MADSSLLLRFLLIFTTLCAFISCQEFESHGAFNPHHMHDAEHDAENDHIAILGSKAKDKEWHNLSETEAKNKLSLLAKEMDRNSDGLIQKEELKQWIYRNFRDVNQQFTKDRFQDADVNQDGFVSWKENLAEGFGFDDEDLIDLQMSLEDGDDLMMIREEKLRFDAADKDGDGKLNYDEFFTFVHPEEHAAMHPLLIKGALKDRDKDKDGAISWEEYIEGIVPLENRKRTADQEELYESEYDHFENEFDMDHDGKLTGNEIVRWLVPDDETSAENEAEHLINLADDNSDGQLSIEEIQAHYSEFVGSEATKNGDQLREDL